MTKDANLEKITALAKRRGFIFPSSEIYGGLANVYDFGPLGAELKNNIKQLWWDRFVHKRDDIVGLDSSIFMNSKVWEASGHVSSFTDPLIECKHCHSRFRTDALPHENLKQCPHCGEKEGFSEPKQFNLMFKTHIGATEEESNDVYLRPETAQAIFINFKNILDTTRKAIPFGVAQMGKAFRNEITTGYFIFRMLEFEQMEIEYFIHEKDWERFFDHWKEEIITWAIEVGISKDNLRFREHDEKERSHYSKRTVDLEYNFMGDFKEIYGLAYRGNYDLAKHKLMYVDQQSNEQFIPHVIEPSFGVERTILPILLDAYHEEEKRIVLKLKPRIAPYKTAVFPLVQNKEEIVTKAQSVHQNLVALGIYSAWDARGNIGKRYLSQDEIGTPYCITIDYDTLKDNTVTVRDRDTTQQERIKIDQLQEYLMPKII
ncbi:glycine--tRNA ligase [Candidatus Roizmanbacteria bacterium RIFCSPLOWO2_02_FULL_37_19]|uniref:Glycine--tRNA ligase n=1 Tax=Candidatus Roizmanbacteria bacterium RIFCSPHIGHO2_02_FULL_37_24 TaxID=1802037 RepID=A0A1F7GWK4_9BACT|nr:MAG: glycine--tRNA ligase [Candidatus Roizmanbacteria bacterium RIFCSPHIGHO2_02_FULL_37_24]OGK32626.1 MAG: glycine--tRNA ligase [Candidatus Roizmanbacteria bacterium RIFCSPHIGHO2_12_FULL_37_23]OGK53940.1 MAG: glycine--tRNA ligase [Candidatus Roizmanbacteria bacterium RIFCSPLOWO2_02_FULL_37_19]